MRPPTTAKLVAILAALLGALVPLYYFNAPWHDFFDLHVYYGAINGWLHDGVPLYDWVKPQSKYGFTYPTFAALLMSPMAVVSWHTAVAVHVVLSVSATLPVLYWLARPLVDRLTAPKWFTWSVVLILTAAFEPVRETFSFGQVNLILLFLVLADVRLLLARGSAWAGAGIGLAAAIKLTPGVFVLYLLVTKRWRAAAVATGVATAATLASFAIAPATSRAFWFDALLDTDRVGSLSFISNQSLRGVTARLDPDHPSAPLWLLCVVAVLVTWFVRVSRARTDLPGGIALTAVLGCLISPVTWVHHLVWLMPALILLVERALTAPRDNRLVGFGVAAYLILCSRLVWYAGHHVRGVGSFLYGSAYVWISLALLLLVPLRRQAPGVAEFDQDDLRRTPGRPGVLDTVGGE